MSSGIDGTGKLFTDSMLSPPRGANGNGNSIPAETGAIASLITIIHHLLSRKILEFDLLAAIVLCGRFH